MVGQIAHIYLINLLDTLKEQIAFDLYCPPSIAIKNQGKPLRTNYIFCPSFKRSKHTQTHLYTTAHPYRQLPTSPNRIETRFLRLKWTNRTQLQKFWYCELRFWSYLPNPITCSENSYDTLKYCLQLHMNHLIHFVV